MMTCSKHFCFVLLAILCLPFATQAQPYTFVDVTDSAGVANWNHRRWGATWSDYNKDGWMDLYTLNGEGVPNSDIDDMNTLYRNNGDGTFTDVTEETGAGDGWVAMQNVWGDYDRDGDLDLYSHNFNQSTLYQNIGNVFTDVNDEAGTSIQMPNGTGAAWGDYDNDGWLDLHANSFPGWNVLFHNNGDGTFTDVQPTSGMNFFASAMGDTWADYDRDGDQDLAMSAVVPDTVYLYRNNGDGTFTDWTSQAGIVVEEGSSGSAVVWVDYNNDGLFDLWLTEVRLGSQKLLPERMYLFENRGDGTFEDVTLAAGLILPGTQAYSYWDGAWADYDNDGNLDLYVAMAGYPNVFFRNNGDGTFTDITDELGLGFEPTAKGIVWADYDNDGDVDYYVLQKFGYLDPNILLQNQGGPWNWLQVELLGRCSNLDAIGAEIRVMSGGKIQSRLINGGDGLFSQHSPIQHFGLRQETVVEVVEVRWPLGRITTLTNVAANQRLTVTEDGCPDVTVEVIAPQDPIVIDAGGGGFAYDLELINHSAMPQTVDLWASLSVRGITIPLRPRTLTLLAGQSLTRTLFQGIPAGAPGGVYTFSMNVGAFPEVVHSDRFSFTKAANDSGTPSAETWESSLDALVLDDLRTPVLSMWFESLSSYPNPFNPSTTIRFILPESAQVRLVVFDVLGRQVRVLLDGTMEAGIHEVAFDADGLPSGRYLYRLETPQGSLVRTMLLAK